MSQTAPQRAPQARPGPQPAPGAAPGTPVGRPGTAAAATGGPAARDLTEDVPKRLNQWQAMAAAACVLFGVLACVLQVLAWQAQGRAAANTEQVVRVQEVQSLLLRADALATNGFLVGGLEPADQRAAYDAAIDDVLRLVTEAADAQPADRAVLAELNTAVTDYTTAVAQARDYNRQQFPIGIAYLNVAGDSLREQALPIVRALVAANAERAEDEMGGQHPVWLFWLGLAAVAVLWWVNRQLAVRFHRRFNVGVAGAAAVLAVLTLLTALHASSRSGDNEEVRDGAYRTAVDEASARTAANDAKAQESQGLINRGSGDVYEETFAEAADVVAENASPRTLRLWDQYLGEHRRVRELDERGDWEGAVALATSPRPDAPTAVLDEVDHAAQEVVTEAATEAADGLRSGGFASWLLVVLTGLGSLAAAGAVAWGINQRRREYS